MYWLDDGWPVVGDAVSEPQAPGHAAVAKPDMPGDWTQWIDYNDPTTVKFKSDGGVSLGGRIGKWQLHGSSLDITWSAAAYSAASSPEDYLEGSWQLLRGPQYERPSRIRVEEVICYGLVHVGRALA